MTRRPLAALLALALGAACAGGDDAADQGATSSTTVDRAVGPAGEGPNGFRPDPVDWDSCGALDCATVQVPLDYDQPDGELVDLFVTRAAATGDRIGPLFVNPGGPGGSAAEFASLLPLAIPESVNERFDIVGVEPRGVGGSAAFECGVDYTELYGIDPTVEDAADRTSMIAGAGAFAEECAERAGALLPHVGTRDVARDLDAVRAAMGDPQLSYYGASYGTAIGQVYAELFPQRLRAMVLDGIVELGPSGLELAADQAAGFEVALQRFADHCAETGTCAVDDQISAVEDVLAGAERPGGIPARRADRAAGPGEVSLGLAAALYAESLWPQLDDALAEALDGDGSGLVALADQYLEIGDFDVYFAVNCIDYDWPRGDPDAFLAAAKAAAAESPHFGEAIVTDYLRCVDWPVAADPLPAVTAEGAPPIVVISTTGDPATPYEGGVRVAAQLASGVLLTNEAEGHGAVPGGSSCITAAFAAYLIDLNVPADGSTCP